jgi:hypothetical protein
MIKTLEGVLDAERVHSVAGKLRSANTEPIDKRLIAKQMDPAYVAELREETIRFLALAASCRKRIAPSVRVDDYWHELVLNTPWYQAFNQRIGSFIHHIPTDDPPHEEYARTLAIYKAIFGEPNSKFWKSNDVADCCGGDGGSQCGDCNADIY